MPTVMLVDDDPDVRMLIRVVLGMAPELSVIAEAANGVEALTLWRGLRPLPDVIILDNEMPGMTGLEVAAQILEQRPQQVIVMCTINVNDAITTRAAELGITFCASKRAIDGLPDLIKTYTSGL